jgi:CheY-like chemotaxis protein
LAAPTILCADDDRGFCQILSRALRGEGYRVEAVHDGASAVERVRELSPSLVMMDVLLPVCDGFAALEAIRAQGSRMPVILLSGCRFTPPYHEPPRALGARETLTKPVPLRELLALVARHIGSGPDGHAGATQRRAAAPAGAAGPVLVSDLEGTLEELAFPALLHHLHGLRATGALELSAGKKKKQVQLRDGQPVAVRSNLVDETLGSLLVASGKITWDVMHESLRRVKAGEGLQGRILMAMQMLDAEDLAAALNHQAEEKLFEIFSWKKGRYRFLRGARLKSANALTLKRSAANVILEGAQLRTPLEVVDAFLERNASRVPVPGESPFYRFQEIALDPQADRLLARVDGTRRIAELPGLTEPARRTLYALLCLELLELRDEPTGVRIPRDEAAAETAPRAVPPVRGASPAASAHDEPPRATPDEGLRIELAAMAERLRGCDHFEILGVARNASDEEIRRAYTDLAKRTHPDRFSGSSAVVTRLAEEVFGLVSRAYEVIGERTSRLEHLRSEASRVRDQAELEEGHRALRAELEFQKGEVALRARRYDVALAHFEKAVEGYPEEGEYRAYYGWALYLADPDTPGRLQEALRHVLAGRKLAPDREKPYLFLGRLYKAGDRMRMAEKMFTRAVQLDPDCTEALRELRLIHMRRQKSKGLVSRILRR